MARRFVCWLGVAAALAFVRQPATAGERKPAAVQAHHVGASVQSVALAAPARFGGNAEGGSLRPEVRLATASPSNGGHGESVRWRIGGPASPRPVRPMADSAGKLRTAVGVGNVGHGEFSFVPVTPLKADPPSSRNGGTTARQGEQGPATPPRERKSITFFRLDPKLGDVSVQPVIGGVNGAQLSVGF